MARYFLGIDAGTTVIKAILVDEQGRLVQEAAGENEIIFLSEGRAEIDLEQYWRKVVSSIRQTVAGSKIAGGEVRALAISAHGVTLMPVDKAGNPLRQGFSYLDSRTQNGKAQLIKDLGPSTAWPIACGMLWMKRNEPEIFGRFHKLATADSYLTFRLTGRWATVPSMAGTTGLVDFHTNRYRPEALAYLGIGEERLCEIRPSGAPVEKILPSVARELGLSEQTTVVCGALDQAAGCLGIGNIEQGVVSECTGTVLAICATVDDLRIDGNGLFPHFYHALEGKYILLPYSFSGGRVLKWFRDEFFPPTDARQRLDYAEIVALAQSVPPGSDGLLMLPHLAGAGYPECNEQARGVFFNIDLRQTRAHFVRALLESIGYMSRRNIEMLQSLGLQSSTVRAIGGAARSRIWNQLKADILQMPVVTSEVEEVPALGAAILAAVGSGYFPSIKEACKNFVRLKETFQPDGTRRSLYDGCYHNYVKLYERVKDVSMSPGQFLNV